MIRHFFGCVERRLHRVLIKNRYTAFSRLPSPKNTSATLCIFKQNYFWTSSFSWAFPTVVFWLQIFGQGGRPLYVHHTVVCHTYRRGDGKRGLFDGQFCHHRYGVSGQRGYHVRKWKVSIDRLHGLPNCRNLAHKSCTGSGRFSQWIIHTGRANPFWKNVRTFKIGRFFGIRNDFLSISMILRFTLFAW